MRVSRRKFLRTAAVSSAVISLHGGAQNMLGAPPGPADSSTQAQLAADPLRPQFHLLPARNWMNDPNGPIYWKGHYHMFFQYNPNAAVWGDMHWAHAVGPDMIHWKHLPVALAPTPGGYDSDGCFSGSAVDDQGLATILYTGVKTVPPQQGTLRDGTHNFLEVQCLATCTDDELCSWQKLTTPVLFPPKEPDLTGFRDPCLCREGNTWYMGIGSGIRGEGGGVLLYRSKDLRRWDYLHPLAMGKGNGKQTNDPVDAGEMWECPDFFALGKKHLLLYSTERKVYWEAGEFDPKELVFHSQKRGLLDHGAFYAPKSQVDAKGRRILWGWIPETRPEAEFSAAGWAGCMSLPHVLTLAEDGALQISVLPEIAELRKSGMSLSGRETGEAVRWDGLRKMELAEASAELELQFQAKTFHLKLTDGAQDVFSLGFDVRQSGHELQIGEASVNLPSQAPEPHQVRVFLDASVVECFVDEQLAWTTRTYRAPRGKLHVEIPAAELDAVESLRVWPLRPISPDRLTT